MVSPLIALMMDQVRSVRQDCVQSPVAPGGGGGGGGSIVDKEFIATEENLRSVNFLPTRSPGTHQVERSTREPSSVQSCVCDGCLVVAEAHCVSKW